MQVYLDNSATTKPSAAVIAAMTEAMESHWHNPSSLYRPAMDVEKRIYRQFAREGLVGCTLLATRLFESKRG